MFVRTLSLLNIDSFWAIKEKFQTQLLNSSWGSQAIALVKRLQSGGLNQNSLFKRVTQFTASDCFVVRHRFSMLAGGSILISIVALMVKNYINPPKPNSDNPETSSPSIETNHNVPEVFSENNTINTSNIVAHQEELNAGNGDGSPAAAAETPNGNDTAHASNAVTQQETPLTEGGNITAVPAEVPNEHATVDASTVVAHQGGLTAGNGDGSPAAQEGIPNGTSVSNASSATAHQEAHLTGNGDGSAAAPAAHNETSVTNISHTAAEKPKRRMGSFRNPECGLDTPSPRKSTNTDCAIM